MISSIRFLLYNAVGRVTNPWEQNGEQLSGYEQVWRPEDLLICKGETLGMWGGYMEMRINVPIASIVQ